ncbi:MAG: lipid II flippase MurJ [Nocardioidaceae bacterium]
MTTPATSPALSPASGPSAAEGTARDSAVLGVCTAVSRATGLLRVVMVGAVLGPTLVGNAFQVTNSLPSLVYYGFLAGSLTSSIVVPVLVRHLHAGRVDRAVAVSGSILGLSLVAGLCILPVLVLLVPALLSPPGTGSDAAMREQAQLARLLILFTCPQILMYVVIGSATSVMYARRNFVIPAAAPAVENLGVVAVLVVVALLREGRTPTDGAPRWELLVLGAGSTVAVALHASVQWWGARRCGVIVRPRAWRHQEEVSSVVRGALHGLGQASLLAGSTLVMLVVASRVPGGAVALQVALNFYFLPIALVAAPVGLAVLPRLASLSQGGRDDLFRQVVGEGLRLVLVVIVPAAVGCALVAHQVVRVVSVGAMATGPGIAMTASALSALAVGLVGQALFFVASQACFAVRDTRTPVRCMLLQTIVCVGACGVAVLLVDDETLVELVALSYAVASTVGGMVLTWRVVRPMSAVRRQVVATLLRSALAAACMAVVVGLILAFAEQRLEGRFGAFLAVLTATVAGAVCYGLAHLLLRSPDLALLRTARTPRTTHDQLAEAGT